jgi:hypothetical protein
MKAVADAHGVAPQSCMLVLPLRMLLERCHTPTAAAGSSIKRRLPILLKHHTCIASMYAAKVNAHNQLLLLLLLQG